MEYKEIEKRASAIADALLRKYFGNIVKEAAIDRPETIGDYTPDLPLKIEAEYREALKGLWAETKPGDTRTFDEILDKKELRDLITEDDREGIADALKEAQQQTLWEKITKTNHEDVTYYKGLLEEYTRELLFCMRHDFMEEVTEKRR